MKTKILLRWAGLLTMVSALAAVLAPMYRSSTMFYWGNLIFLLWFFCYTFGLIGIFIYYSSQGKKWTGWIGLYGLVISYIYWDLDLIEIGFGLGFILLAAAAFFSKAQPRWVAGLWLLAGIAAFADQFLPRSGIFSYLTAWYLGLGLAAFVTGFAAVRRTLLPDELLPEDERLRLERPIEKPAIVRLSGWALIIAGLRPVFFILGSMMVSDGNGGVTPNIYQTPAFSSYPKILGLGVFLSPFFMLVGMLGLRARYGQAVGIVGRLALTVGAFGDPLLMYSGQILNVFYNGAAATAYLGVVFSLFCLAIFGVTVLVRKPLPHLNWLPVAPGILFLVAIVVNYLWQIISGQNSAEGGRFFAPGSAFQTYFIFVVYGWLLAQFAAAIVLGFILKKDIPEEEPLTTP